MFDYLNLVYWAIAIAGLLGWARFATFVSQDVEGIASTNEVMWRGMMVGALFLMPFVFILMPSFWVAFPLNLLIAGSLLGAYWMLRVKEFGPEGHLFSGTIKAFSKASAKAKDNRAAARVNLTYMQPDNSPMPLPHAEDPAAAGLEIMDQLMIQALERHADLIELIPSQAGYDLKMYIDGVSYSQPPMQRKVAEPVIATLKTLAALQVDDRRRPQEGKFKVKDADEKMTVFTIRTSGTTAGERLALSAASKAKYNISVDELGFSAEQLAAVKDIGKKADGVVLVATPRGAGRTTTLYALVRQHDAFTNAIHVIEAKPEAELEGVSLTKFDPKTATATFSKTLGSIFLKEPNVVMINQLNDAPAADAVATYGETEHRLYVGLTAPDTFAGLEQWLQLISDKEVAANALRAVISQRLVRVLCQTCRVPYQPDPGTLKKLNLPVGRNLQSFKANTQPIVDKKGNKIICPDCGGTGYRGRTGIFEVLIITPEMRKAIATSAGGGGAATINTVRALARKANMLLLVEHGIRKFASGVTSIQEVLRVVQPENEKQRSS